jgi:hypothetical protein
MLPLWLAIIQNHEFCAKLLLRSTSSSNMLWDDTVQPVVLQDMPLTVTPGALVSKRIGI